VDWLSSLNFWSKQNDFFRRHHEGTGKWIFDTPEFKEWLDGTGNVLWCPGICKFSKPIFLSDADLLPAGAGKTILTYAIYDNRDLQIL
jgi:hypothetical protein